MIFIDSNIPMYAAGKSSPQKSASIKFLAKVRDAKVMAFSSVEVLQEILHRYHAIKRLTEGFMVFESFLALPIKFFDVTLEDVKFAKDFLEDSLSALSSRDSLHLAVMRRKKIKKIVTYDQGFLGVPHLTVLLPHQV